MAYEDIVCIQYVNIEYFHMYSICEKITTTVIFSHIELVLSVGLHAVNENLFKLLESLMGNILMTEILFCYYENNEKVLLLQHLTFLKILQKYLNLH